jgi:hypothetical protein
MDFSGRYSIPAPPGAVWAALHDPAILAASIPGCENVERIAANAFAFVAATGPATARFEGKMRLDAHAPPPGFTHALTLTGDAQGGTAGFATAEAEVRLTAENGGTVLAYDATASLGGQLALPGQRPPGGVAKTPAEEFFATFIALMQRGSDAPHPPGAHARGDTLSGEEGLAPQIWIAGLIGIVIILLILFGIVL